MLRRCLLLQKRAIVSKSHISSIFRVEVYPEDVEYTFLQNVGMNIYNYN